MKITTNTPDLLVIDDRPVFIAIMLIFFILAFVGAGMLIVASGEWLGLLFGAMGGGMGFAGYAVFVRRTQLVMHRPGGWVEIRHKSVFSTSKVRHELSEISAAETDTSRSSEGTTLRRVVLIMDHGQSAGRHPVTEVYTSGPQQARVAEAINSWLAHSSENRSTG